MLAYMNIRRYTQLHLTLLENEQSVTQFITTSIDSGSWILKNGSWLTV